MRTFILSTLAFFSIVINQMTAQDLHIYYDLLTDKVKYKSDKKTLDKPVVKVGEMIYLHLENYNNYIYDVEIASNSEVVALSAANANNLLSGDLFGLDASLFSNLGGLSALIENNFNRATEVFGAHRGSLSSSASSEFIELQAKLINTVQTTSSTEKQLIQLLKEVEDLQETNVVRTVVLQEIANIKQNPSITPEKVKELSLEYLKKALQLEELSTISLEELLSKVSIRKQLTDKIQTLDATYMVHDNQIQEFETVLQQMKQIAADTSAIQSLEQTAKHFSTNAVRIQNIVEEQRSAIAQMEQEVKTKELQLLSALRYEYESLMANDFTYNYRAEAEGDKMKFNITLKPKTGLPIATSERQLAPISVSILGRIQVNSSVGVGFGQYFSKPQTYSLRNGVIIAEEQNGFSPYLSSFIHFYSQGANNVSVGGSFGVGVPLTESNGLQSATFFLGGSLFLGRSERIVFTAGVLGGKVDELAQGFEVGDNFISDASLLPTTAGYQLGAFIGVSFNLMGGGN